MTTTTSRPATVANVPTAVRRTPHLGWVLPVGPLVLLAGQAFHPEEPSDGAALFAVLRDHRTTWFVAHALMLAGVACFGPALLRLARIVRDAAPKLSVLGAVTAVLGMSGAIAVFGASLTMTEAGRGSQAQMAAYLDRVLQGPGAVLFVLVPGLVLSLAFSLSALARLGRVSWKVAVLAPVGLTVGIAAPEPLACFGTLLCAVGLVMVGRRLDAISEVS